MSSQFFGFFLAVFAALVISVAHAQNQTWFVTDLLSDYYSSSTTTQYGSTAVTPVPPTVRSYVWVTTYTSEPIASRNTTVATSWTTTFLTEPVLSHFSIFYTTPQTPPTVTSELTATAWTSPVVATVTLSSTTCTNGVTAQITATEYSGEYKPLLGQVTTLPISWPTAITWYLFITVSSRLFAYVGDATTVTATATRTTWASTTTATTTITDMGSTHTRYHTATTMTSTEYHLEYANETVAAACLETPTVTYAAQCAPTNLISERDGHGVEIGWPRNWTLPIGFPNTLIGIPGMDAPACCQLCLDNNGCAASEWAVDWGGACSLYYYNQNSDTCGVPLEYFADFYGVPRQDSYLQLGCGSFTYLGVMDPTCPTCPV